MGGLELLTDERGLQRRGRSRRGLLAGAVVGGGYGSCYPSSSPPLLPVFSSRGRRVLSSYTPLGSIGLTPGSIGQPWCCQVAPLEFRVINPKIF